MSPPYPDGDIIQDLRILKTRTLTQPRLHKGAHVLLAFQDWLFSLGRYPTTWLGGGQTPGTPGPTLSCPLSGTRESFREASGCVLGNLRASMPFLAVTVWRQRTGAGAPPASVGQAALGCLDGQGCQRTSKPGGLHGRSELPRWWDVSRGSGASGSQGLAWVYSFLLKLETSRVDLQGASAWQGEAERLRVLSCALGRAGGDRHRERLLLPRDRWGRVHPVGSQRHQQQTPRKSRCLDARLQERLTPQQHSHICPRDPLLCFSASSASTPGEQRETQ